MKKARRVIRFLSLFPQVPGRVWVDAYSIVALYRFVVGLPVDVGTLGVILGTYAVSSVAKKYAENTDRLQ
jgi:hypothetical protein